MEVVEEEAGMLLQPVLTTLTCWYPQTGFFVDSVPVCHPLTLWVMENASAHMSKAVVWVAAAEEIMTTKNQVRLVVNASL